MSPSRYASMLSTTLVSSALVLALIGSVSPDPVHAQSKPAASAAKKAAAPGKSTVKTASVSKTAGKKTAKKAAAGAGVAAADEKQLQAANAVHFGESGCEFGKKIQVSRSQHPGYVDLSFNKKKYTMKPILSPTGALRLEDVGSEALMIQIPTKTMVMNQKTGQRLVDNCVHASQKTVTADSSHRLMR